jgi:hypothetical protein
MEWLLEQIKSFLEGFLSGILTGMLDGIVKLGESIYNIILGVYNLISGIITGIFDVVWTILQFFGNLLGGVINAIIQFAGGILAGIGAFFSALIDFIVSLVAGIIEVIRIVALMIDVVRSIAGLVLSYIFQGFQLLSQLVTGVNSAPVQQIPGLPRCVTAPLESQICAVWYIGDYTMFAPGTPGAYIIPILVVMIDIFILVYVIRSIFRLVRWFQTLYQVV